MKSPCIKTCQIDQQTGLCLGCFRSLDEIASWTRFSDDQRAEILADLPMRQNADGLREDRA